MHNFNILNKSWIFHSCIWRLAYIYIDSFVPQSPQLLYHFDNNITIMNSMRSYTQLATLRLWPYVRRGEYNINIFFAVFIYTVYCSTIYLLHVFLYSKLLCTFNKNHKNLQIDCFNISDELDSLPAPFLFLLFRIWSLSYSANRSCSFLYKSIINSLLFEKYNHI